MYGNKVDYELSGFLWGIPTGFLYPRYPIVVITPITLDRARFIADVRPHRGLDVTGMDDVGGDVGRCQFGGKVPGELIEGNFCSGIGTV